MKQKIESIGYDVRGAFLASCRAGRMAFADNLAGACAPATAALMVALAMAGIPSAWANGQMLKPALSGPHTWAHVGEFYVDLTATQSPDPTLIEHVRIVRETTRYYKRTAYGVGGFGRVLDFEPSAVSKVVHPWHNERAIVDVVAAAMKAPREDVEPHALAVLWGDEARRRAHATPRIILAELEALLEHLPAEDAYKLVEHARKMAAARRTA